MTITYRLFLGGVQGPQVALQVESTYPDEIGDIGLEWATALMGSWDVLRWTDESTGETGAVLLS